MSSPKVRVRFAPSPTGPLHIGGVRTALYNYLFAKKNNGDFILRIEDTDQQRLVKGAEEYIIESLTWCGLKFDEGPHAGGAFGPYRQSERKEIYKRYAAQLIQSGNAYYAFDTSAELEAMRERLKAEGSHTLQYDSSSRMNMKNSLTLSSEEVQRKINAGEHYVIRIKTEAGQIIKVNDIIRGEVEMHSEQMDDKVLFKSDGMPTYHLANVVDDYLMQISHVIRGEEWLPSAPLHVYLYQCFGWTDVMPQFAHLPLLLRPDGNGKLSKRDGDRLGFPVFPINWTDPVTKEVSSGYRERGYFDDAFVNMLALLGWHPSTEKEIFSMEELIHDFSLERVSKSGAKFDPEKARWFNQQYLRMLSDEDLAVKFTAVIRTKIDLDDWMKTKGWDYKKTAGYVTQICRLVKEKVHFAEEMWEHSWFFFLQPGEYEAAVIKKKWNETPAAFFSALHDAYTTANDFSVSSAEKIFHSVAESKGIAPNSMMQLARICLLGVSRGPGLFETIALLGKEETVSRLELALKKIPERS